MSAMRFLMVSSIEKEKVKGCEGVMCLVCLGGFQAKGNKNYNFKAIILKFF